MNEQRFKDRLLQQYHEERARVVQLQAVLAQKDDQLATANAQLQRVVADNNSRGIPLAVQSQINSAMTKAMSAENHLKETVAQFNRTYANLTQQNQALRRDNKVLRESGSGAELTRVRAELRRVERVYRALQKQKQDGARNRSNEGTPTATTVLATSNMVAGTPTATTVPTTSTVVSGTPTATASAKRKVFSCFVDDDQDDEEVINFNTKSELARGPTSGAFLASSPKEGSKETRFSSRPQPVTPQRSHESPLFMSSGGSSPIMTDFFSKRPEASMAAGQARAVSVSSWNSDDSLSHQNHTEAEAKTKKLDQLSQPVPHQPVFLDDEPIVSRRQRTNAVDVSATPSELTSEKKRKLSHHDDVKQKPPGNELFMQDTDTDSDDQSLRPSKRMKKRLSERDHLKDDVKNVNITNSKSKICSDKDSPCSRSEPADTCETQSLPPPEKHCGKSIEDAPTPSGPSRQTTMRATDIKERFVFKAIKAHGSPPEFEYLHSIQDLADDTSAALWDHIHEVHDARTEGDGEFWLHEIEVKHKNQNIEQCISSKLKVKGREKTKSRWRPGCKRLFACKKCVAEGRPCFVWKDNEFLLLPLHEDDRKWPVTKESEVRHWINVE